jgi:hypothetical protein
LELLIPNCDSISKACAIEPMNVIFWVIRKEFRVVHLDACLRRGSQHFGTVKIASIECVDATDGAEKTSVVIGGMVGEI